MIFSQQTRESYSRLRTVLGELLKGQNPVFTISENLEYPLLVLETSDDAVGFAVVNGTPKASFDSAYVSFKQLYSQNHDSWKNQNLSFVLCRSETNTRDDAFYGSVEADMYFCRKYVVRLGSDRETLENELLRLPFTPLPEAFKPGVKIPPSAQTLLQSINIPASLAHKIVSPGVCSAGTLIKELMSDEDQLPILHSSLTNGHYQQAETKQSVRIKRISIESFRAYRKRQEFDLDADVIVLFGPNGLGKTSLFDAIDYVCTGRIGRFCRSRISQRDFKKIARHLDAPIDVGLVSMQVSKGGEEFLVTRKIADWSNALIDKERHDRSSLIQFLTSAEWSSKKPRINKLEGIFRATHLFSQTDPELLTKFDQESTLSKEIVSRLLALDDYSSALKKVADVQTELEKRIKQGRDVLLTLEAEDEELRTQKESLPEPKDTVRAGNQLRKMASELAELIGSEVGVKIEVADTSQASAREWRAMVEAAQKNANENLLNLKSIERGFTSFSKNSTLLKHDTAKLAKLEVELEEQTAVFQRKQQAMKKLTRRLKRNQNILKQANTKILALSELADLHEVTQIANNSIRELRKELVSLSEERDATNTELQQLIPDVENLHARITDVEDELQARSDQIQELTLIHNGLPLWKKEQERLTELEETISTMNSALERTNSTIDELKVGINEKEKELQKTEKELLDSTNSELALTRLLDEIEAYVHNGICPTCGTKHTSRKSLIGKIHSQKQARPAHVEARVKRRNELQNAIANEKNTLEDRAIEQYEAEKELKETEKKLVKVRESIAEFENAASKAEFLVDQHLAMVVARKIDEEMTASSALQESLKTLEAERVPANRQITKLERKLSQQDDARKRARDEIKVLEEQIAATRGKVESQGLILEMNLDEIATVTDEATARKNRASDRINDLAPQVEGSTQSVSELKSEIDELAQIIDGIRQNMSKLDDELERYREKAVGLLDRGAIDLEAIHIQRKLVTEREDRLDDLRRQSLTLERALDASQRSAMFAELEAKILSIAKDKKNLGKSTDRMEAVMKWFSIVKNTLYKENSSAVANYVDAFGPLTTLIQKRLRVVYGFGDVSLNARGDEIKVLVSRNGKQLRPANYFSESQKQILMLSIFLSGRLTQTWSGFAPILMDDPVTHFDDLNDFGFVEFMRGVIGTSPRKQQFFISTCEERLFDLMLKKFSGVDREAKFYRFEGIGPDGPAISEIVN